MTNAEFEKWCEERAKQLAQDLCGVELFDEEIKCVEVALIEAARMAPREGLCHASIAVALRAIRRSCDEAFNSGRDDPDAIMECINDIYENVRRVSRQTVVTPPPRVLDEAELEKANPYKDVPGIHWERTCFARGAMWAMKRMGEK